MKRFLQIVVCLIAMTSMARAAAPVISNVLVTATTPTSGTITWTTDIPSTSMLQYGTTSAIPYQTNVNYTLTTTHSMTLPLLTAGPLYYVAAVSGDNAGNNTQSATITFSVCGSPTIPVSGTVNNYYEYGSYTLTWIPPTGTSGTTPTACGAPIQKTITGNLSGSASFTTAVADASKVVPGPGQWEIQATDAGNLAPITTYAYLAQSSQDVSPALQLAASTAGLTACIINTLSGITYPTDCGGGALSLQHNGVPLTNQKVLNFNDAIPAPPGGNINVTFQSDANGDLSGYIPTGGIGGCPQGVCIQNSPTGTQTVTQPAGTTLQANNFQNAFYAALFGTGSNGIEAVYNNPLDCIPQGNGISDGCNIQVSPLYTNSDFPQGWKWQGNYYGGTANGLGGPSGMGAFDLRNGDFSMYFRDPYNPLGGQSPVSVRTDITQNLGTRDYIGNGAYNPTGLQVALNQYAGGWDFQFYPYMTQYVGQNYEFGLNLNTENWSEGITFGEQEVMNCHSLGDCLLEWKRVLADGGIQAGSSEGTEDGDVTIAEDNQVFTGVINALTPTSVTVGCTLACNTEGPDRLVIDYQSASAINGNFATGNVGPQTTGSAGNSAIMPPEVLDTAQSFPVSTMFQLCNPGSNNGAGGAAGCTVGSQPIGVIPPTPLTISVTAGSVTSNVASLTGANALVAGQSVILYGFSGNGAPLNNVSGTVSATGLTTSAYQVNLSGTVANIASTGTGISTQSPTGFSPPQSITLNVVAPYTGTGGDTNGLPSGFCSSSTLQSSNSGASCYLPASGYLYLTDGIENESDAYTYNSGTQQITITGMYFPHLNGVVGSYGGLAGWAIQDNANLVNSSSGLGVSGTIAPTYLIAGAASATSLYYMPVRVNEQYGLALIGISNPSNGNQGYGRQLYFSEGMSSFSLSGSTVTFTMANPPEVSGDLHQYNGLSVNIVVSSNTTYSCTGCTLTWVSGSTFTYAPSAPSGSSPTAGTVTYNNAGYSIYPAARITSVFDTATNSVDGKMQVFPYTVANDPLTVGDYARVPHFQQIQVTGRHQFENQYQPSQFTGSPLNNITYNGFISQYLSGFTIINNNPSSMYLGRGGNWTLPGYGYSLYGDWTSSFYQQTAPDLNVIQIISGKSGYGISSLYSNFNVLNLPSLSSQSPQPGANGQDCLNYDPYANIATRSAGTDSGTWYFDNCQPPSLVEGSGQQSFGHVRMGYANVDQGVTANNVTAKNIFTTQSTSITIYANAITTGSTTTNYWVVGHAAGGGMTLPVATGVLNGASTPNNQICMPYQSQYSSYDVYRGSTSNLIATGVVVNGTSVTPVQPANYACLDDNNISPTSSPAPTSNTTGGVVAAGPLVGLSVQDTSVNTAGCAQFSITGILSSTGSACGSGGGGGSVTSVAMTVPGWLTVSGSPITSTGTFAVSGTSEPQNYFIASPNGSSGAVSARAIVVADIPTLPNTNLATMTANSVLGAVTATTPSDLAIPSCSGVGNALTWTSGTGFGCATVAGGISGLTVGYIPVAGSTTSLTGNSHIDDGVTTGGTITSTEPISVAGAASGEVDFYGSTSGEVRVVAQSVAGTPTLTLPTTSGQITTTTGNTYTLSGSGVAIAGTDSLSVITMTGSGAFTMATTNTGQGHTLCFIQGSGSYQPTAPANVHGLTAIGVTNGKYNCQHFIDYTGGSVWLADSSMQQNE